MQLERILKSLPALRESELDALIAAEARKQVLHVSFTQAPSAAPALLWSIQRACRLPP